jgi:histidinol-phosphatase (PHP family)
MLVAVFCCPNPSTGAKMNRSLYETHLHTPLCRHAWGEPEAYAAVALQHGLKGIIVTCHNPTNDGWSPESRMALSQFPAYLTMVDRARQQWAGLIDVRLGLESDYVPGMEPWLETLHRQAPFDYILGAVHPHLPDYKQRYFTGDIIAFQRTYFEHLALAAETGLFDALAHPDLVKIVHPGAWQPERLRDTIGRALDRIQATGIAMELNTYGLHKNPAEMHPGPLILQEMQRRGIPVVIGSDAHQPHRVADNFEGALDALAAVGYTQVHIFLNHRRHAVNIPSARRNLHQHPNQRRNLT